MIFMKLRMIAGILISCLCLSIAGFAYADETVEVDDSKAKETLDKYRVIDTSLYDDETYITRNDGLSIILRAIGTTNNISIGLYRSDRGRITLIDEYYNTDEAFTDFIINYLNTCKFTWESEIYSGDYVSYALNLTDVVNGEINTGEGIAFNALRPITANETLAFMVRCLDNRNVDMDVYNLEDTFKRAEDLGLIKETDAFYSDPDDQIAPDDFFVLVNRFIHQKRYLYFNRERGYDFSHDEEGSMTYLDYLDATFELGKENDFGALA